MSETYTEELNTFEDLINSVSSIFVLRDMQKRLEKRVFIKSHCIDMSPTSDLVFVDIDQKLNEWMCHEEGEAIRIHWQCKGKSLMTDHIRHSSKHTYTVAYRITYDDKVWVYSKGSYEGAHGHDDKPSLMLEDIFELFYEDDDTGEYRLDKVLDIFDRLFPYGDIMEDEEFHDFLGEEYCCEN